MFGRLKNVNPHHPPDQEQGDCGNDEVFDPLPRRLRLATVLHAPVWSSLVANLPLRPQFRDEMALLVPTRNQHVPPPTMKSNSEKLSRETPSHETTRPVPEDRAGQTGSATSVVADRPMRSSRRNVSAITTIEKDAMAARSGGERVSDAIAHQAGRTWFIAAHAAWFGGWILVNAGKIPGIRPFDPFPYQFLTFVVSLEAIFLSLFILMSQNRANKQADARSHLDLQINMLSEQESTKMLQMLQSLCEHHKLPVARDPEVDLLKSPTKPAELLTELQKHLPENS